MDWGSLGATRVAQTFPVLDADHLPFDVEFI
jgi:hypothetical protein